ncbi:hypothetical protein BGZ52_008336 [Haplosporangium bisporale]|nr:hypothetical protein BGZ52_008336 [Haplosporangium bisporale]
MSDPIIVFADLVSPGEGEVWTALEKQKDEEQKDTDGFYGLKVHDERTSNHRHHNELDLMLLADEFLVEELREQEDYLREVEERQKGWDMNTIFPEDEMWNDLGIDMELEVQENEEKLK